MDRQELVKAILDLENDRDEHVVDPEIAYDLGHHVKTHIDELVAVQEGGGVEVSGNGADPGRQDDEIAGLAAAAGDGEPKRKRKKARKKKRKGGETPPDDLLSQPPNEQAKWIFMERFISLQKHEEILRFNFEPDQFAEHQGAFDATLKTLLHLPLAAEAVANNDLPALQKMFASCVLIFRNPLVGDDDEKPVPCTFELLREYYPSYFFKRKKKPNWFENSEFYTEPLAEAQWVLCDSEYLNCTLRKPDRKLLSYARDWDLPGEYVRQKTVVEDIYDRIICGEALEEDLFARGCNSLTSTTYKRGKKAARTVYTVQRAHKITIHGKSGVPHWKASKRLWPGVYPTMIFP